MRIQFSEAWCLKMARDEIDSEVDIEIGGTPFNADLVVGLRESADEVVADANVAFGRFVRLMRRNRRLTVEELADRAEIDITELVEIEEDNHHKPGPHTVYRLAEHFELPMSGMLQLAGLTAPKNVRLSEEAIRFAARSEIVEELKPNERAALDAFVSVLSEKS